MDLTQQDIDESLESLFGGNAEGEFDRASQVNPDRFAESLELARDEPVPLSIIMENVDEFKRRKRMRELDFDDLKENNPVLHEMLLDPEKAPIVHDDVERLRDLEWLFTKPEAPWYDKLLAPPAGFVEGIGLEVGGVGRFGQVTQSIPYLWMNMISPDLANDWLKASEKANKIIPVNQFLIDTGKDITEFAEDIGPEEQDIWTDILKGVGQIGSQLLMGVAGRSAQTAGLFSMGMEQQARDQEQAGTYGQSPVSDLGVLMGGGVTMTSERIGLDILVDRIPPKIKNRIGRYLTDLFLAGGSEAVQEVAEGIGQGLVQQATTGQNVDLFEGLDREAIAAGGAGAIARALINMVIPGRIRDTASSRAQQEVQVQIQSLQDEDILNQFTTLAQESATNKRAGDLFAQFMNKVGPDRTVYINEDDIADVEGLPDVITAQMTGESRDIELTLGDVSTHLMGDDALYAEVRPHMRLNPDSYSQAQIASGRVENYAQQLIEQARVSQETLTEAERMFEDIRDQLVGTERQSEITANLSAQVIPAYVAALAERKGLSVTEVFDRMGLRVAREDQVVDTRTESPTIIEQKLQDRRSAFQALVKCMS